MNVVIVSDLHLGSKYCRYDLFLIFVRNLPPGWDLVLNGDTIDRWHKRLLEKHKEVLAVLVAESYKRRVIWVRGNHDKRFKVETPNQIEFVDSHAIGDLLFISHGINFDRVMPFSRLFIFLFRCMHRLRVWLGAESVHVAFYAKKFRRLYEILRTNIRTNAVAYAKQHGFKAVTCGHTHCAEDVVVDGIEYINTGAWTEEPICYISVCDSKMELKQVHA
jgi:UDP-2,3-diacylglucosamine pyrophosphatase LpxH